MTIEMSIPQSIIDAVTARDMRPVGVDVADLTELMERPYYVGRVLTASGDVLWFSGPCRTEAAAVKRAERELKAGKQS